MLDRTSLQKGMQLLFGEQSFKKIWEPILYGKFVGEDNFGNKYYQSRSGKRWVIYSDEIDASKIPVEWFSWMHFMPNKIENNHELKKYQWQKPHQSNQTGTESAYYPNKNKKNAIKKKYKTWK